MNITYSPDGLLVAEVYAYETMKNLHQKGEDVAIGSDTLMKALSLLIAEGVIPNESVVVHYNGLEIEYDEYGMPSYWPEGFVDTMSEMNMRLVKEQTKKRLATREV